MNYLASTHLYGKTREMIIFDGTYRLPVAGKRRTKPRTQWTCAWRIRIIDLAAGRPDVRHLKPIFVIASPTGPGTCLTSCAESIGKNISRDFSLDIRKILWVEHFATEPEQLYVAAFKAKSRYGPEIFYDVQWRRIRSNEMETVKPFIP